MRTTDTRPVGLPTSDGGTDHLWQFLSPPSQFGSPTARVVGASGVRVRFADGVTALCATSGLWNANLGYGNAAVADGVHRALLDASYLTLFRRSHPWAVEAARTLVELCGPDTFSRVMFSTSGSAANDVMMKIVRQYWALRGEPGRRLVVGLRDSYHGLTYGSSALTGEDLAQDLYLVDRRFVRHVGFTDPTELRRLVTGAGAQIGAVVVEPVLGTGAHELPADFLAELAALRERHGFLLVADEVATGFGRTGTWFASQDWPVRPDVMVLSKGLTNGTCAGSAVVVSHGVRAAFDDADAVLAHGETNAGTPPTCAAITATVAEMRRLDVVARAAALGDRLGAALAELTGRHPAVAGFRGRGLFRHLGLVRPDGTAFTPADVTAALEAIRLAGAVAHPGPAGIQLVPPLVYTDDDLDGLLDAVDRGLTDLWARQGGPAAADGLTTLVDAAAPR
ncbi:daptide-type RiPP biosynthesis aminotransferase [Parafrankia discariae]|uniref:daptide-type RiPP biosynthesis aminotransferase n=1 Tax=Parafrankia discariae TaxID=365528 RepID=UPI000378FC78|nr:daptide-type RiPP biosynthesis aminotransferase [Parafrankia discariae]